MARSRYPMRTVIGLGGSDHTLTVLVIPPGGDDLEELEQKAESRRPGTRALGDKLRRQVGRELIYSGTTWQTVRLSGAQFR